MLHYLSIEPRSSLFGVLGAKITRIVVGISIVVIFLGWLQEANIYFASGRIDLSYFSMFDWPYSLANWIEPLLLAGAALLFLAISALSNIQNDCSAFRWGVLAWLFGYLSLDESANIHEILLKPLRSYVGPDHVTLWMLPAIVGTFGFCLYLTPLLETFPRPYRTRFILSAILFIGGAVGMEIVSQFISVRFGNGSEPYRITAGME